VVLPSQYLNGVAIGVVFLLSFVFFVVGAKLLALRFFNYLEWLYTLMFAGILLVLPRQRVAPQVMARWAVSVIAVVIFVARVSRAPWAYGPGGLEIFTTSLFDLVGLLA
jgi:hypothetical protein